MTNGADLGRGGDRDLKLDNTLLSGDDPPIVKLCDFGFAKDWEKVADMHTHIGCAMFMIEP